MIHLADISDSFLHSPVLASLFSLTPITRFIICGGLALHLTSSTIFAFIVNNPQFSASQELNEPREASLILFKPVIRSCYSHTD